MELNEHYQEIERLLREVARKRSRLVRQRILLAGAAAVIAAALLGIFLAPRLSPTPAMVLRVLCLFGMAAAAGAASVRAAWFKVNLDQAALLIEKENPWLKNALISSVQLVNALERGGSSAAFSKTLLAKHLETTAGLLNRLNLEPALTRRPLRGPALAAGTLAALLLILFAAFPESARKGSSYLFKKPLAREAPEAGPALPLTVANFTIHYRFPDYTGLPPQTVPNTSGDLAALKGTAVRIEARALEPLTQAFIVTSSSARLAMKVGERGAISGELVLSSPGSYHIEGIDRKGRLRAEPGKHRITVDEDLAPSVSILVPVGDMEVAREEALEISYRAEDDFGLSKVELVFDDGRGPEKVREIKTISETGKKSLQADYQWLLAEEDLEPGSEVTFYLQVTDNDQVSGGNIGRSESRTLTIFSARKQHQKFLARQEELLNQMVDHLAAHIQTVLKDRERKTPDRPAEEKLLNQADALLALVGELAKESEQDKLADPVVKDALFGILELYPPLIKKRKRLLSGNFEQAREKLAELREQYRAALEADILFFDKLLKKQRIEDLLAQAGDLYAAQQKLAELLERYRRTGDAALLDELRDAMARLESAFQNLMEKMAQMRKELPEEFVNAEAMKTPGLMDLAGEMEALRKALADGDMESALELADKFLSNISQWLSAMEESADQFGQTISSAMLQKMTGVMNQIEDLINREQAVEDELAELYQNALARNQKGGQSAEEWEELKRKAGELYNAIGRTRNSIQRANLRMPNEKPSGRFDLNREKREIYMPYFPLQSEAREIRKALEQGNLSKAEEIAGELDRKLREQNRKAEEFMKNESCSGSGSCLGGFRKQAGEAEKLSRELAENLKRLEDALSLKLTEEEQARLNELSMLQQALKQDTETTWQDYDSLKAELPSLPGKVSDRLGQAALHMNDAAGQMSLNEPTAALDSARQARRDLQQAKAALEQSRNQMMQSMMSSAMAFGALREMGSSARRQNEGGGNHGLPNADFELPDAGAYKVPEAFREQILKAMKEPSPDPYKNLNRDYYERLIR